VLRVRRALVSVYDKEGIVEFCKTLHQLGVEIISSGGTAEALRKARVPVKEISEITGFPEMLDGRVKTLQPAIHAGILARRTPEHLQQLEKNNFKPIDLVVVNLYPFKETLEKTKNYDEIIEKIDIGGPSLVRGAAKNHEYVAVVVSPKQYEKVRSELIQNNAELGKETLRQLASDAFAETAAYDALISQYFLGKFLLERMPEKFTPTFEKMYDCRYGENYQQKASFYKEPFPTEEGVSSAKQLNGKELSFNNIFDANAAIGLVKEFGEPTAVIIKHTNPCGVAVAATISQAFADAFACDKLSAFGGIIALNRTCDLKTAKLITSFFNEVVIAPNYDEEATQELVKKKNLRVLELRGLSTNIEEKGLDFKKVAGGLLLQEKDSTTLDRSSLKTVTKRQPDKGQMQSLEFAWIVAKHVKSNAIVLAKGTRTTGIGAGQTSRVDAVKIAIEKARKSAKGSVMASDAFFPFKDSVSIAAKAGITAIIQPGGSLKDEAVIKEADKKKIVMLFTGIRHFKH
jgi:phosphoribosylaminoimidazolecarboxamide formyltransferase/IMP cyclohydrolase